MAKSVLSDGRFHNEEAAFAYVEAELWPNGPICPHCGNADDAKIGRLEGVRSKPSKKNPEGVVRVGLRKCYACREQFTVRIGTIFEDSALPLRLWLQAIHLLCSSKKGFSTRQLQRILGCGLKTAWHLGHRIRFAMAPSGNLEPLGSDGKIVEVDETFYGRLEGAPKKGRSAWANKNVIVTLVERGGSARSFHIEGVRIADFQPILKANLAPEAKLMTDEMASYKEIGEGFASHDTVNHKHDEYVRYWNEVTDKKRPDGKPVVETTTITVEGFFSVFKRSMKGVYQHCSDRHLHRYLSEFDFRYSSRVALGTDDVKRSARATQGIAGKRLMYRDSFVG